jgi:hypothetical protein
MATLSSSAATKIKELLTVVITTSPAKCHPEIDMIKDVIESFKLINGLEGARVIVACDGVNVGARERPSRGIVSAETAERYDAYLTRLENSSLGVEVVRAAERIGFGFGVKNSLNLVQTPYVMVVHHDQKYTRPWDIEKAIEMMILSEVGMGEGGEEPRPIYYVGCLSPSTVKYGDSCIGKKFDDPRKDAIDIGANSTLVPLYCWYDRNHIASVSHYQSVVFASGLVKKGTFIEDSYGQAQLKKIKAEGLSAHRPYGTYLLDDGRGAAISHIDGRRWMTDKQREAAGFPPLKKKQAAAAQGSNADLQAAAATRSQQRSFHHSWGSQGPSRAQANVRVETLPQAQELAVLSKLCSYTDRGVPFFSIQSVEGLNNTKGLREEIYSQFFEAGGPGCIGLKACFSKDVMDRYNQFCEAYIHTAKHHANCRHPKQPGKFVINNLMEALSEQDPDLFMQLVNNPVYNAVMDVLLGFSSIGAFTTHWIEPEADRQMSHVDYPVHIGSGKFWEGRVEKGKEFFTRHQINHVLPFFSVQALMASDKMDVSNGSTEVVPYSNAIQDIDMKIHDPEFYKSMEDKFMNVSLDQGDVFMFNRRLCHRGGRNLSKFRRNSAIMQCVWLFGIGQHQTAFKDILTNLKGRTKLYDGLSEDERDRFHLRLRQPYPLDTTLQN